MKKLFLFLLLFSCLPVQAALITQTWITSGANDINVANATVAATTTSGNFVANGTGLNAMGSGVTIVNSTIAEILLQISPMVGSTNYIIDVYDSTGAMRFRMDKDGVTTFGAAVSAPSITGTNTGTFGSVTVNTNLSVTGQTTSASYKNARTALTHAGTQDLDFSSTSRQWIMSLTGAVTFTTSNLSSNLLGDIILINNQATNCTITWPSAARFGGFQPAFSTAGKIMHVWFECLNVSSNFCWTAVTEEQ